MGMISYHCPTCGRSLTLSADGWAWHRLVEHPRKGLPVHDPRRGRWMAGQHSPAGTRVLARANGYQDQPVSPITETELRARWGDR